MNKAQKRLLSIAADHYREGRFANAEQIYLELYRDNHDHPGILTRLGEIALWKNQAKEAEAYLKSAAVHTSWIANKWPLSVHQNTALAMTFYRQNRFSDAALYFRKAAGPLPVGPFHDLKAMANQLSLFDDCVPYSIKGPETASIPFIQTDPLPVIQVAINDHEPVLFFIDTGGAEIIIHTELARQIGVEQSGTLRGEGGGASGSVGLGKVEALTVGSLTVEHLPVHILNTRPFADVFNGLPIKGAIGTRLLMQFLSTIDYVDGRLILRQKTSSHQFDMQTARIVPFWLIQTHYIVAFGAVNAMPAQLFLIDTGLAGKGFSATEEVLQAAGIFPDWSSAEQGISGFGPSEAVDVVAEEVIMGSETHEVSLTNVPGIVFKKPFAISGYKLGFYVGGVISHQFFRNYALTLDFSAMQLLLHESTTSLNVI